jgi:hypothetical protein
VLTYAGVVEEFRNFVWPLTMFADQDNTSLGMLRKQFLLTLSQCNYLHALAQETGESEAHFVRQAIDEHARGRKKSLSQKIKDTLTTNKE